MIAAGGLEERRLVSRFWDARHLALGTANRAPGVRVTQVKEAVIRAPGDIDFHVDGEPDVARDHVEVRILPAALRVKTAAGQG